MENVSTKKVRVRKLNFNLLLWCLAGINGRCLAPLVGPECGVNCWNWKASTIKMNVVKCWCAVVTLAGDDDDDDATKTQCMAFKYKKRFIIHYGVSPLCGSAFRELFNVCECAARQRVRWFVSDVYLHSRFRISMTGCRFLFWSFSL